MREGVDSLLREKTRPPGKAPIAPEHVAEIVRLTHTPPPRDATHWTLRAMAQVAGVAASTVRTIWQAHGLAPRRWPRFKLSNDPTFADKLTDIVDLYVAPPAHAVVLSIDEKTQIQALDRIERTIPAGTTIHAILDSYATHKHARVRAWLAKHPRWTFHFTPTSCSWLNAVEGFFAKLTRRRLRHGVFRSVRELRDAIHRFIAEHNAADARPFFWAADPEDIIAARKRGFQTLEPIHSIEEFVRRVFRPRYPRRRTHHPIPTVAIRSPQYMEVARINA